MVLNNKKINTDPKNTNDEQREWIIMKKNIRTELNQVDMELNQTSHEDKLKDGYRIISKMLNMRDQI